MQVLPFPGILAGQKAINHNEYTPVVIVNDLMIAPAIIYIQIYGSPEAI